MKEYMRENEVLEYFDISKGTLSNWRKKGLEFIKVGGLVIYDSELIKKFLDNFKEFEYER